MVAATELALFWIAASGIVAKAVRADDCNDGEQQLEFTLFLDEDSMTENGWSVECDGEGLIWNVPPGTLQRNNENGVGYIHPDSETPYIKEQTCLPQDFTCHFTLEDLYGDGLLFPGYYYLTFGAATIAVAEQGEEFFEKAYCFGPNCPVAPKEVNEDCDSLYLFVQADYSLHESSVAIECNGETVFAKSDFMTPQEAIEVDKCVPTNSCCTFTIEDSSSNGLEPLQGGNVFLEWANQVVFQYDNSSAFKFETVSIDFGKSCEESSNGSESDVTILGPQQDMTELLDKEENIYDEDEVNPTDEERTVDGEESLEDKAKEDENKASQTTADSVTQDIMGERSSISAGAKTAIALVSSLLGMAFLVWFFRPSESSQTDSPPVKDIELHSASSSDTDREEE